MPVPIPGKIPHSYKHKPTTSTSTNKSMHEHASASASLGTDQHYETSARLASKHGSTKEQKR